MRLGLALALASSACSGGGGPDSGPPDAPRCAPEDLVDRVPVENATGLRAGDFGILFGGRGGGQYGMDALTLPDGSLLAWTTTPNPAPATRSTSEVIVIHADGRIDPVRIGDAGYFAADSVDSAFRVWDDLDQVHLGLPQAYNFEVLEIPSGGTIAEAETIPVSARSCNGVGPYSPHVSDGRYLTIALRAERGRDGSPSAGKTGAELWKLSPDRMACPMPTRAESTAARSQTG
jgi:hypothetical protein